MKQTVSLAVALLVVAAGIASASGVNSPVRVRSGEVRDGELSSVNGGITLEDASTVHGRCSSVNGGIDVGDEVVVEALESVNGSVRIGRGSAVERAVESVNGSVSLATRAQAGSISTVNGTIELDGAEVTGDVETVNGNVEMLDGARIAGDLIIRENRGHSDRNRRPLRITLRDGAVIEGSVINEDEDRRVEIYLEGDSRIQGEVRNARVM